MGSNHPNTHDKDHLVRCVFLDSQEIKRLDITPIRGRRYAPILAFFSPPSTTEVVAAFVKLHLSTLGMNALRMTTLGMLS